MKLILQEPKTYLFKGSDSNVVKKATINTASYGFDLRITYTANSGKQSTYFYSAKCLEQCYNEFSMKCGDIGRWKETPKREYL